MFKSKKEQSALQECFNRLTDEPFNKRHADVMITKNYNMFTSIAGNRNLNPIHLKNLKESIAIKQIPVPIVVNEKYQICDGQNRFQVCCELNLPVYYIVIEGLTLEDGFLLFLQLIFNF